MKIPDCVHPRRFEIDGLLFEVVSFSSLTDEQAAKIAMHFYRSHKFKKTDQGKLFQVVTMFDGSSAGLL